MYHVLDFAETEKVPDPCGPPLSPRGFGGIPAKSSSAGTIYLAQARAGPHRVITRSTRRLAADQAEFGRFSACAHTGYLCRRPGTCPPKSVATGLFAAEAQKSDGISGGKQILCQVRAIYPLHPHQRPICRADKKGSSHDQLWNQEAEGDFVLERLPPGR